MLINWQDTNWFITFDNTLELQLTSTRYLQYHKILAKIR